MILLSSLLIFSTTTILADHLPSECDFLKIYISNQSPYKCILSNKNNKNGKIVENKIPKTLMANTEKFFTTQDITGIDLSLTYNCENNIINFSISRPPVTFSAQPITINYSNSENTNISYSSYSGSCWWGNSAQLTIKID